MRYLGAAVCIVVLFSKAAHSTDIREATEQLIQAEQRWNISGPEAYSFTVSYRAFVLTYGCQSQAFRVSGSHSTPKPRFGCKSDVRNFGSVPALFRLARKLLAQHPGEVSAEYDSQYGYPIKFYVGSTDLEDDYFQFTVVKFKASGNEDP